MKSFVVCVLLMREDPVLSPRSLLNTEGDGMPNLDGTVNRMTRNLNQNIMNMNQQIQNDLRRVSNEMSKNLHHPAISGSAGGPAINANVTGDSIIVSTAPRISKIVVSMYGADGQAYYRDGEDQVIGSILYHKDKIYNPSRGTVNEFRYTLNLSDPNAKPVLQTS